MSNFIRVYSDNFTGQVFTRDAFEVLKEQLCNGDSQHYEIKEISSVEIGSDETVYDVEDLLILGFARGLTEQTDEGLFETALKELSIPESFDAEFQYNYGEDDDT